MRTYAPEQKSGQPTSDVLFSRGRNGHPLRQQEQTVSEDARPRPLAAEVHGAINGTAPPARGRFHHDFSQLPLRSQALPDTEKASILNESGAGLLQDNDEHSPEKCGKSTGPQREEEPVTLSGNGGPAVKPAGAAPVPVNKAATPPKLTKKTISGPTDSNCGGFNWVVQWELDKKTTKGGWVVQKVELPYSVKNCSNKAVDPKTVGGLRPGWYPIWEAWEINKNQKVTTYAEGGDLLDDTYVTPGPGGSTKGSVTVKGKAEYYEGLKLPSSFKVTNKPPAGILPVTTTAPNLTGGTGSIAHNLTANWDCCSKDKAATKKTTITTV